MVIQTYSDQEKNLKVSIETQMKSTQEKLRRLSGLSKEDRKKYIEGTLKIDDSKVFSETLVVDWIDEPSEDDDLDACINQAKKPLAIANNIDKDNKMNVRAKFEVKQIVVEQYAETVKMEAVYGGTSNKEDNTFSEATPSASLSMTVTNKNLWGHFKPGQKYYLDFTPAAA